jgi:hypothetical protein
MKSSEYVTAAAIMTGGLYQKSPIL